MKINNLPKKYEKIWKKSLPILEKGRSGDNEHAKETVNLILDYDGKIKIDKDVLVPVAIMHDIGHSAILPEHFKYITGPEKIINGKLVHLLVGAKIADDILRSVGYNRKKSAEIVEIIAMHDFDQLNFDDWRMFYDSNNKKVFHDIDALDRYTKKRIESLSFAYKDKNQLINLLEKMINLMFYDDFKYLAKKNLDILKIK